MILLKQKIHPWLNISCSSQCSTTDITKAVVCVILSVDGAYEKTLTANQKE